ncbi:structural maintenance of chromosomes protein 2-like [Dorcoceras hygrometricum]|uniref:Structural maintenance of chromosomes protein 2-like n=1 Tax=Dorcoceras hygrometricum TaxID=472368 RepID=A0A2Z7AW91_9LAMI|nr:structural maintenance of chromosomes protein 2-like [Dorcoceras hygrometricum]
MNRICQRTTNNAHKLKSGSFPNDNVSLPVERIKADTDFSRHSTVQLRKQLETSVDGLEIKIDVLESTLVRHFADSQQAFVKSQLAEMVDCLKELRDAKKGEGLSKGPGPSIKMRRLL